MDKIRKAYVDAANDQIHYLYSNGQGIPLLLFHRTPASSVIYERMMEQNDGQSANICIRHPRIWGII